MIKEAMVRTDRRCAVCGGRGWRYEPVLWPELIAEWCLSSEEVDYLEHQQGDTCVRCRVQRRCVTLADAIRSAYGLSFVPFRYFWLLRPWLRILEINHAGALHRYLARFPRHRLVEFPAFDMQKLPFPDASFDLIVHSDTLEHVPDSERGLRECLRVVGSGLVAYTVPLVVGRRSRRRGDDEPGSFHGNSSKPEFRVITEYGADVWVEAMRSGATEVRMISNDHPASHAILIRRR